MAALLLKLCNPGRRMLLSVMGILVPLIIFFQFWAFPSRSYFFAASSHEQFSISFITIGDASYSGYPVLNNHSLYLVKGADDNNKPSVNRAKVRPGEIQVYAALSPTSKEDVSAKEDNNSEAELGESNNNDIDDSHRIAANVDIGKDLTSTRKFSSLENSVEQLYIFDNATTQANVDTQNYLEVSTKLSNVSGQISVNNEGALVSPSSLPINGIKQVVELEAGIVNRAGEESLRNESLMIERYVRKMRGSTITFSEMESILLKGPPAYTISVKGRWSAARDRELVSAKLQIKNAPILRNVVDLYAPLFRNVSVFKRSYELMERILKIYTYKEGEKPIFHQPKLRGLYAAEGWFMKLLERSKHFSVRDPKRAHLFYLPFSSETLRLTLYGEDSHSMKNLERYLTDYVTLIKKKYRFWNRTGGADHFFVACHDWAPRITREHMSSCIRTLCNANAARGFSIGKDVSVPVTYVRSGNDPLRDIGGKPSSERHILAFFAGRIHGYLRPLLLKYWENKASDMKIFGPMQRDVQGKAVYREFMKSSKYCICARGYGVHTPRVVESIFYECVPVIISDNYVPPFFEVLDWEAFAVFIEEKDIPNLRNILLSIPEDRYHVMQMRVKMVQKHFVWHKVPEKYDLFHMILHSIWYNRISQMRPE